MAVFCRQAHAIGAGVNNEYLEKIESVGELEAFAAVVYSSNFEFESPAPAPENSTEVAAVDQKATVVADLEELKEEVMKEVEGFESAWDKASGK